MLVKCFTGGLPGEKVAFAAPVGMRFPIFIFECALLPLVLAELLISEFVRFRPCCAVTAVSISAALLESLLFCVEEPRVFPGRVLLWPSDFVGGRILQRLKGRSRVAGRGAGPFAAGVCAWFVINIAHVANVLLGVLAQCLWQA